ncbi:MAG TPA: hypothetical protein VFA07_18065 [Chthonomonadaceae bacterium]|nr:hypothetical protein [Chthonomonadaceae bacterium]
MKAQSWQKLLTDKGWLQGDQLVVPDGCNLSFIFHTGTIYNTINHDQVVEITDMWITASIPKIRFIEKTPCLCYHLWEDLCEIHLTPKDPKEANLLLRPADKTSAGP